MSHHQQRDLKSVLMSAQKALVDANVSVKPVVVTSTSTPGQTLFHPSVVTPTLSLAFQNQRLCLTTSPATHIEQADDTQLLQMAMKLEGLFAQIPVPKMVYTLPNIVSLQGDSSVTATLDLTTP